MNRRDFTKAMGAIALSPTFSAPPISPPPSIIYGEFGKLIDFKYHTDEEVEGEWKEFGGGNFHKYVGFPRTTALSMN